MSMFNRRLQILIDEPRYARLARKAEEMKTSIAEVVREAVDRTYPESDPKKMAAFSRILAADPMDVPADAAELKALYLDDRVARIERLSNGTDSAAPGGGEAP